MDKEYVVHKHNGVLFSCKHESDSTTCSKMDATGGHYVERNKPETERKKKHALPYMWELNFKKKKKSKKKCLCISVLQQIQFCQTLLHTFVKPIVNNAILLWF